MRLPNVSNEADFTIPLVQITINILQSLCSLTCT